MKNILVVESNSIALHTFVNLLQSQAGILNFLAAGSARAAFEAIERHPIDMVITGLQMPELDSFELVRRLVREQPQIRIIVMTNNSSPMLRTRLKQVPSAVHFDRLQDIGLLCKRIFAELNINYGGRICGISLSSFLQMLELEKNTGTLYVSGKGRSGWIGVSRGAPAAAQCGSLRGTAAAVHMLTWSNVIIEIDFSPHDEPREITRPLINLIIESGRVMDEKLLPEKDHRQHERFNCLVAVDYDLSDWTYQCYLQDISIGGAYIETSQPLKVDQKIVLTLCSSDHDDSCALNGKVVRRDPKGIGVHFENLSLKQKAFIEKLTSERAAWITTS